MCHLSMAVPPPPSSHKEAQWNHVVLDVMHIPVQSLLQYCSMAAASLSESLQAHTNQDNDIRVVPFKLRGVEDN